jgi:hypothetical protein
MKMAGVEEVVDMTVVEDMTGAESTKAGVSEKGEFAARTR